MAQFDKTNTAIAFVSDGLFNKDGVEALGKKPVISIKANIDGVEKEISLWFSKSKETGEYNLTSKGTKFLTGKVKAPYVNEDLFEQKDATETPVFSEPVANPDAELPF